MPKTAATQWIRLALGSFLILLTLFGQAAWVACLHNPRQTGGSLDWTWAAGSELLPGSGGSVSYQVIVD